MSEGGLVSLFRTVDKIKSAIELGQSEMVIADTAKLVAQVAATAATEGFLRTYSALEGFGKTLSLWRMGQGVSGAGIAKQQALSAFVASELVGALIDGVRDLHLGGWLYDVLHPPVTKDDLRTFIDDVSWIGDHENGSEFYLDQTNFQGSATDPDAEADFRLRRAKEKLIPWKIVVTDMDTLVEKVYQGVASPIVIDLGGDGIHTTNSWLHSVDFDITGDGVKDRTAWISGDDAFLAIDKNKDGVINDVSELFGGLQRGVGFAKLAEFDTNHDGRVDKADGRFNELRLWQDKNMDGISDAGEIVNASTAGLESIGVNYSTQDVYQQHNLLGETSTAIWQGTAVDAVDVYFRHTPGVARDGREAESHDPQSLSSRADVASESAPQNEEAPPIPVDPRLWQLECPSLASASADLTFDEVSGVSTATGAREAHLTRSLDSLIDAMAAFAPASSCDTTINVPPPTEIFSRIAVQAHV